MFDSPPCPLDMHMCTLVSSWHAHVSYGIASPPYMVNDDRLDRYITLSECQDSVRNSMQRSQVKHRQITLLVSFNAAIQHLGSS